VALAPRPYHDVNHSLAGELKLPRKEQCQIFTFLNIKGESCKMRIKFAIENLYSIPISNKYLFCT